MTFWSFVADLFYNIYLRVLLIQLLLGSAQPLSIPLYIHLEEEILVLFWICWVDGWACSRGGSGCVLGQQQVCGSISMCNCSMPNLIDDVWDGVTMVFRIVAVAWLMYGTWESRERHAGTSGSERLPGYCFICQIGQEGWFLFYSFFSWFLCFCLKWCSKEEQGSPCKHVRICYPGRWCCYIPFLVKRLETVLFL